MFLNCLIDFYHVSYEEQNMDSLSLPFILAGLAYFHFEKVLFYLTYI